MELGGLVRAYSTTAKEAISKASKVEMTLCDEIEIFADYNYHDILQHYFKLESIIVKETVFLDKVHLVIIVENGRSDAISEKIIEKTGRTSTIIKKGTYYYPKM